MARLIPGTDKYLGVGDPFLIDGKAYYSTPTSINTLDDRSLAEYQSMGKEIPTLTPEESDAFFRYAIVSGNNQPYVVNSYRDLRLSQDQYEGYLSGQQVGTKDLIRADLGMTANPSGVTADQGAPLYYGDPEAQAEAARNAAAPPAPQRYETYQTSRGVVDTNGNLVNSSAYGANQQLPDSIGNAWAGIQDRIAREGITDASGKMLLAPTLSSVNTGIPKTNVQPPTFTNPTFPQSSETYTNSVQGQLDSLKQSLQDTYQRQISDLQAKIDASQAKIDSFSSTEKGIIEGQVNDLTSPFRNDLETAERERLHINENFEANQKLVNELDSLLSEGNAMVQQMKGVTGLATIRNPRINQAIDTVNARVGVINAVMAARNGQISQAYNMIDRSVQAITSDRNDRLSYYNTLLNFYEGQKDDEGKKLVTLEANQRKYLDAQIGIIEGDLKEAQATANYIKELMTSPESALFMAEAGISLNDSIPTINAKLASQTKRQQITDTKNDLISKGYEYVPFPMAGDGTVTFSVGGQNLSFKAPAQKGATASIQEYEYAKSQGYTGSYSQYQNEDANRKASIARAGVDGGMLSPSQMNSTINQIAGAFDGEQIVKDYNQATSQYQLMNSLGTQGGSPGDDIAFVYAFAKLMDPNSVVREGEYKTIQVYAQSLLDAKTLEAIRLVKNTNFLTADAKQKLLTTAYAKMQVLNTQYQNVSDQYQQRIETVQGGGFNTLPDYSQAFNLQAPQGATTLPDEQANQVLNEVQQSSPTQDYGLVGKLWNWITRK